MSRATRSRGQKDEPTATKDEPKKTKAQLLDEKKKTKKGGKGAKKEASQSSVEKSPKKDTDKKRKRSASKDSADAPAKKAKSGDDDAKRAQSKDKSPAKQPAKQPAKEPAKEELKKIVMTGKAPVDQIHNRIYGTNFQVYSDAGTTYASTLNQSNVTQNNNKFYILQVLQTTSSPPQYYFWSRWGRVGVEGQNMRIGPLPVVNAISQYQSKLREKSVKGDYRIVEMNYEADEKKDDKKENAKEKAKDDKKEEETSSLPGPVKNLIRLIFDMKMMDNQMKEIGYDSKKMPLGKLAKSSITKGYEALKLLMDEVKGQKRHAKLAEYSNDFYSYIPHDFGFKNMGAFILDTEHKIKTKLQMLQSLEDIQIFTKMLDEGKVASDINTLDSNYLKLKTNIEPIERTTDEFNIIQKYLKNTHAKTHSNYRLEIQDVFAVQKDEDDKRFRKDIGNKMLLWHGSRLTNFVGILSQGLRIAPPEAPVTGYMFGKGVYFADMVSKSANYCFTNRDNNTGLMLLCQVALGNCNEKFYADYYANLLPEGKSSTKGVGKTAPSDTEMLGDVIVPTGEGKPQNIANSSLLYNEFIVYDIAQVRLRYLLRLKFIY